MSDSAAVDAAIFSALQGDATLTALLPDGVWFGAAPQSQQVNGSPKPVLKFAVVTMTDHTDIDMFQQTDHEEFTYAVTANIKDKSSTAANQAAARIDALMRSLPNPTGYTLMLARRTKRLAMTAPDDSNLDDLWQQRGGLYDVHVEPVP